MSYLLSLLVIAWGVLPPALRHAHEGGDDTSHNHAGHAEISEPHDGRHHPHADDRGFGEAVGARPALARDWVSHLHWSLLGFEFSLPTPGDGDEPDDRRATEAVLVRLVDDLPTVNFQADSSVCWDSMGSSGPAAGLVCPTLRPSRPSNRISSLPLCDSARFERSGVLLV